MQQSDEEAFENAIKSLEATAASVGVHWEIDSTARQIYAREIKAMSDKPSPGSRQREDDLGASSRAGQ